MYHQRYVGMHIEREQNIPSASWLVFPSHFQCGTDIDVSNNVVPISPESATNRDIPRVDSAPGENI